MSTTEASKIEQEELYWNESLNYNSLLTQSMTHCIGRLLTLVKNHMFRLWCILFFMIWHEIHCGKMYFTSKDHNYNVTIILIFLGFKLTIANVHFSTEESNLKVPYPNLLVIAHHFQCLKDHYPLQWLILYSNATLGVTMID